MKKSTKIAHINHKMRTVSVFGTAIFVAFVAVQSFTVGSAILQYGELQIGGVVAGNIIGALVAFAIPPVAYFIGDNSTKSRSRYEHYYNGVLFALMSLGLGLLISLFLYAFIPGASDFLNTTVLSQFIPSVIALCIALIVGRAYHKKRHQHELDAYRPFQVAFITPMLLMSVAGVVALIGDAFGSARGVWHDVAAIQLLLMVVMLVVPLFLTHRTTLPGRLMDTYIAFGIGTLSILVFSQVSLQGFGDLIDPLIPFMLGSLVWLAFVYYYFYRKR